jgi:hypothetical protein
MRLRLLTAALAAGWIGAASAEEAPGLMLTIHPSGVDTLTAEAREREERLRRRMEQADFLFRNICTQCGGGIKAPGAFSPFDPVGTLNAPPGS